MPVRLTENYTESFKAFIVPHLSWKSLIDSNPDEDAKLFFAIRERFVEELLKVGCPTKNCKNLGSKTLRSDIDVTIQNMDIAIDTLLRIESIMFDVFKEIFKSSISPDTLDNEMAFKNAVLKAAKYALDLNFYVSDYGIEKPVNVYLDGTEHGVLNVKQDDKHYMLVSKCSIIQRHYAYLKWPEMCPGNYIDKARNILHDALDALPTKDIPASIQQCMVKLSMNEYTKPICNVIEYIKYMKSMKSTTPHSYLQEIIDRVSTLIGYMTYHEDDAYATQASFMRWVPNVIMLPYHMQIDCLIEQICMAHVHQHDISSFMKYISRAATVDREIFGTGGHQETSTSFLPPGQWWSDAPDFIKKKKIVKNDPIALEKLTKHYFDTSPFTGRGKGFAFDQLLIEILKSIEQERDRLRDYESCDHVFNHGGNQKCRRRKLVHI